MPVALLEHSIFFDAVLRSPTPSIGLQKRPEVVARIEKGEVMTDANDRAEVERVCGLIYRFISYLPDQDWQLSLDHWATLQS